MNPEFLSGEASASPAVEPMLAAARRLAALGFGGGAIAARNGLRTTTHANLPFDLLTDQDFLEVADYDPHLDRLLCIGKRAPQPHAGMHALMLRAKREVGALVMVDAARAPDALRGLPQAERGKSQLDNALAALEKLRGNDAIAFGQSLLVASRSVKEALRRTEEILAGASR